LLHVQCLTLAAKGFSSGFLASYDPTSAPGSSCFPLWQKREDPGDEVDNDQSTILEEIDGKFVPLSPHHPPPPQSQGCENGMFRFLFCFILHLGLGGGAFLFPFILSKIVA